MIERDVYRGMIEEISAGLKREVAPLVDELLAQRPAPRVNPAGFIYFHILRSWDRDLNHLILGQDPAEDAWHRLGLVTESGFDPAGTGYNGYGNGTGYTDKEVDAAPAGKDLLIRYHDRLLTETREFLDAITDPDAEFDRAASSPLSPTNPFTVRSRMQHLILHTCKHLGEIQLVKGMLGMPDPSYPAGAE